MAELIKLKQIERDSYQDCYASRNGNNQPIQFLRREDRSPTNDIPFEVAFDGTIYAATVRDRDQNINATWELQVNINGTQIFVLPKPAGQNSNRDDTLSFDVNQGDKISIAMINQSETIRDPAGSVHIRKRR